MITHQRALVKEKVAHPEVVTALQMTADERVDKHALLRSLDASAVGYLHEAMRDLRAMKKNLDAGEVMSSLLSFEPMFDGDTLKTTLFGTKRSYSSAFSELDADLSLVGMTLADLTVTQAMIRDLELGEVRVALVARVVKALGRRKYHNISANVLLRVQGVLGKAVGGNASSSSS